MKLLDRQGVFVFDRLRKEFECNMLNIFIAYFQHIGGIFMMEVIVGIIGAFLLYELIKTQNELVELNETVRELKEE
jgi:hypothetical protein